MSKSCFVCCIGPRSSKTSEQVATRVDAIPDTVEMATGLSAQDRNSIKDTAEIIFGQLHLQNKGVAFLISFFKAYPHHQRYFKTFRGIPPDDLKSIPHTENHGRRVMNQLAVLVQHLEEPAIMKEQLNDLLCKHNPRNVKPRQMKDMLNMFVEFIRQQLGTKFTCHHEAAWRKMVSYILSVLEDASVRSNGAIVAIDNGKISRDSAQAHYTVTAQEVNTEEKMEAFDGVRHGSVDSESESKIKERTVSRGSGDDDGGNGEKW